MTRFTILMMSLGLATLSSVAASSKSLPVSDRQPAFYSVQFINNAPEAVMKVTTVTRTVRRSLLLKVILNACSASRGNTVDLPLKGVPKGVQIRRGDYLISGLIHRVESDNGVSGVYAVHKLSPAELSSVGCTPRS